MSFYVPEPDSDSETSDSYHSLPELNKKVDVNWNQESNTELRIEKSVAMASAIEILGSLSASDANDLVQLLIAKRQRDSNPDNNNGNNNSKKQIRKNVVLPKWNGEPEDFDFYIGRLETRIQMELASFLEPAAICLDMIDTLPESKKPRVADWFQESRSSGKFDWEDLIKLFRKEFENKDARQAASEIVSRMEQGKAQYFVDFLREFEYRLAQSGGNEAYTSLGKTQQLKASLNPRLRRSLIGVKLPSANNYKEWVAAVKEVASELEGLPGYRSKNAAGTTTVIGAAKGGMTHTLDNFQPAVDEDGDTVMGGANALLAAIQALMLNKDKAPLASITTDKTADNPKTQKQIDPDRPKPRAPWRSVKDFKKLQENGLCTRCAKKGHIGLEMS